MQASETLNSLGKLHYSIDFLEYGTLESAEEASAGHTNIC